MYKLLCQKPAQMIFLSSFFQMFIVLGMYNFASFQNAILVERQLVINILLATNNLPSTKYLSM